MPNFSTGTTSIQYGQVLRIEYRPQGSSGPYTLVNHFPTPSELPYTVTVPTSGVWEVQYTIVCPNCSGNTYSTPVSTLVNL